MRKHVGHFGGVLGGIWVLFFLGTGVCDWHLRTWGSRALGLQLFGRPEFQFKPEEGVRGL